MTDTLSTIVGVIDPWQAEEDRIVGRALRSILAYENVALTTETEKELRWIVESAVRDAENIGARPDYVRDVFNRLTMMVGHTTRRIL